MQLTSPPTKKILYPEFDDILTLSSPTIIGGDFNSANIAWNNTKTDSRGRSPANYVDNRGYAILAPLQPTRPSIRKDSSYNSVLDFFLVKNITNVNQLITMNALSSDHLPVTLTLNQTQIKETRLYLDYKNADWTNYTNTLEHYQNKHNHIPLTIQQIDDEILNLTKEINSAKDLAIKKKPIPVNTFQINDNIKKLISDLTLQEYGGR